MDWNEIVIKERNKKDLKRHQLIQENEGLQYHIMQGIANQVDCTKPLPVYHKRKWKDSVIGISIGSISDIGSETILGIFKR